jgi:hypothetical protein
MHANKGYIANMEFDGREAPVPLDAIDDVMAAVIRSKTGADRLRIASGMYASARRMILSHLRTQHSDWDEQRIVDEVARRLSHGAD